MAKLERQFPLKSAPKFRLILVSQSQRWTDLRGKPAKACPPEPSHRQVVGPTPGTRSENGLDNSSRYISRSFQIPEPTKVLGVTELIFCCDI